jgi:hypothetical protein
LQSLHEQKGFVMAKALLLIALFLPLNSILGADGNDAKFKVVFVLGEVTKSLTGEALKLNSYVTSGEKVTTGPQSLAEIMMADESRIRVGENSVYTVDPPAKKGERTLLGFLEVGKIWLKIKKVVFKRSLKIKTPSSVVAVRGTTLDLYLPENSSGQVNVFEGRIDAGTHLLVLNDSLFGKWVMDDQKAYEEWLEANDPDKFVRDLENEYKEAIEKMQEEMQSFMDQDALDYQNFLREQQGLPPLEPKDHGALKTSEDGGWMRFVKQNQTLNLSGDTDKVGSTVPLDSNYVNSEWVRQNQERDAQLQW